MPRAQQVEFLLAGVRDANGNALSAGLVYHYKAGTTTDKDLYSASDKSTSHVQPAVLDSAGRLQAWGDGAYKFVIKTSAGVTVYTFDNLVYGYDDGEAFWGGTSGGTGNAHTVSISSMTAYAAGQRVQFIAGASSTGPVTLNCSSLGNKSIKQIDGTTALTTEIVSGNIIDVEYDGTNFRFLSSRTVDDWYLGATSGSANAYTGTLSPVPSAYASGQQVIIKPNFENTSAATINFNSLGAKNLKMALGGALPGGYLSINQVYSLVYDGTNFYVMGNSEPRVFARAGSASVTATITETTLGQLEIPGGLLGTIRCFRATFHGVILNNTGADRNFRFRVKCGPSGGASTTYLDSGAASSTVPSNATYRPYILEVWIHGTSATNTNNIIGRLTVGGYTWSSTALADANAGTGVDFTKWSEAIGGEQMNNDFTVDRTLYLTMEHSNNSANMTSYMNYAMLEYL